MSLVVLLSQYFRGRRNCWAKVEFRCSYVSLSISTFLSGTYYFTLYIFICKYIIYFIYDYISYSFCYIVGPLIFHSYNNKRIFLNFQWNARFLDSLKDYANLQYSKLKVTKHEVLEAWIDSILCNDYKCNLKSGS